MQSEDVSKQFPIFSVSRLELRHELGFSEKDVKSLTDEDMWKIVDQLRENLSYIVPLMYAKTRNITQEVVRKKGHRFG